MRLWASLVLLLLSTGCAGRPAPASSSLRIVQTQTLDSLNPIYVSGLGGQELAALLFSYLVKIDDRGRLVPDVAREVPSRSNGGISADGKTITYHLRAGVRFSDGSALTSHDVAYTIGWVGDRHSDVPSRLAFDHVTSVDTPDELTVRIHLRRPYAPALMYLCAPGNAVPILPAARVRDSMQLAKAAYSASPVGSGPYELVRWDRGERVTLRANPTYWAGKPSIETIQIRFVPSSTTALGMLRTGEADAYVNADATQYRALAQVSGVRVRRVAVAGTGALLFNTQDAALRDRNVRLAFAQALDVPQLVDQALAGVISPSNPGRGLFLWAYDRRAFAMPRYNRSAAAARLDAAGWRMGGDGVRHKDGQPLALTLIVRADKPSSTVLATAIQSAARATGIDVEIRRYPVVALVAPAARGGPLYGGHYAIALFPFLAGFDPDMTDQFACDRIPPHGFNKPRYCNPHLDALMRRAASTYVQSQRVAYYRDVQRILARDLPLLALYQAIGVDAFPERLVGPSPAIDTPFWNVASWRYR